MANLQEQLRIAQQTQGDQANEIGLLRAEVERLKEKNSALNVELEAARKTQALLQALQAERDQLQSRLEEAKERKQVLEIATRSAQAQEERLKQDLASAKATLLKTSAQPSSPPEALPQETASAPAPEAAAEEDPLLSSQEADRKPDSRPAGRAVIQRVSTARDFFVASLHHLPQAEEGTALILSQGDQPLAEVEVSSLNASGLAVLFVTRALQEDLSGLEAGGEFTARLAAPGSAEVSSPERENSSRSYPTGPIPLSDLKVGSDTFLATSLPQGRIRRTACSLL